MVLEDVKLNSCGRLLTCILILFTVSLSQTQLEEHLKLTLKQKFPY